MGPIDRPVFVPDFEFPGTLAKRMAVRDQHLENARKLVQTGFIDSAGPTLKKHPAPGEAPQITGSSLIVHADSEAEIHKVLESDVYAAQGVWDLSRVTITPLLLALRRE